MSIVKRIKNSHALTVLTIAVMSLAIVWSVIYPFARFRLPIGWDTPAYLGYATSILRYGWGYVMNPTFFEWKGLRVIPTIPLLLFLIITKDVNSYIVWVSTLSIFYLASVYYISREVLRKPQMVFYSLLFTSISYNYIRTVRGGFFDQLFALTLMNVAIACLVASIRKGAITRWKYIVFFMSQLLMWFTHLEIAAICSAILIAILGYAYISSSDSRSRILKAVVPTILSSTVGVASWISLLPFYLPSSRIFLAGLSGPQSAPWDVMWKQIQKALLILEFMSMAQILFLIRRGRADAGTKAVFVWTLTVLPFTLIAYIMNPILTYRIFFLLPISLLLSYGTDLIIVRLLDLNKKKIDLRWVRIRFSIPVSRSLASVFLAAIVIIAALDASQTVIGAKPYISSQKVTALESLASYIRLRNIQNNRLIVVIYPLKRMTHPIEQIQAWVTLYDNWIQTYVGHHLTYYGPIENLLTGVPLNTTSPEEDFLFQYYWTRLRNSQGILNLTDYLVTFLPDWYHPITLYETNISNNVDNHFYVVKTENTSNP